MKRRILTRSNRLVDSSEYRWVLLVSLAALAITCIPYLFGWSLETEDRIFGSCILLDKDCYSYLAKMRQGAEGAWLFHIVYTPEPHPGAFFFPFHLLLGKIAALLPGSDLTARMMLVYQGARLLFGLGLLLTIYRFLSEFAQRTAVRRLAWLMTAFGGGLGWLLVVLGQSNWLGTPPLDFYLPEGFAFLVLLGFPHIAAAQSLLLWGLLFLLKAWKGNLNSQFPIPNSQITLHAAGAGVCWLLMGLIVPFYVPVAWAVAGAALLALALRKKPGFSISGATKTWFLRREGLLAGLAVLLSAPVVVYSAWVFTTDRVYATWAAQNLILSPHPFHYLSAYGAPLLLAAFAARAAWRDDGPAWLPLAWVAVVPVLVYLPFNLQRRLVAGMQVPLSLLAAWGAVRLWRLGKSTIQHRLFRPAHIRRWLVAALIATMPLTNLITLTGSSGWMFARPAPIFRDSAEITALDWLSEQTNLNDVILTARATGIYLPVRASARVFVGHGLETVNVDAKEALIARFFSAPTDDAWRQWLLKEYSVDYLFWGPAERALGAFDPNNADFLIPGYCHDNYAIFRVVQ